MRRIRNDLTFANVVSVIALFVALSGSAVALEGRNNVDHNDLRKHVVHRGKIHDDAVNSAKIANGQVGAPDLGRIIEVSQTTQVPANSNGSALAQVPSGHPVDQRRGLLGVQQRDTGGRQGARQQLASRFSKHGQHGDAQYGIRILSALSLSGGGSLVL